MESVFEDESTHITWGWSDTTLQSWAHFFPTMWDPWVGKGPPWMNYLLLVRFAHAWLWSPEKAFWYFLVGSGIIVSSSCSTVYFSIHAEYLLNELHSTGGRRVEWLNSRASESDSWAQSCFHTRLPVMLGMLMKGFAPQFPHLTPIMIITTSDAYKTFNAVPSA